MTRWWYGREEAPSALALFTVDPLERHLLIYDVGGLDGVPALALEPDGRISEHPSNTPVRLTVAHRSIADLEACARAMILRAARLNPPVTVSRNTWWRRFEDYDVPFSTFLALPDETGREVLVAVTEPHFFGVLPNDPIDGVALLIFNTRGIVLLDTTDALPAELPILERAADHVRETRLFGRLEPRVQRRARLRAERKAKSLLFGHLTRKQKWELRAYDRITVQGEDSQMYRIHAKYGMNVQRLDAEGLPVETLCVVPKNREPIPVFDLVLAHKVLLQNQIDEFMKVANRITIRPRTPAIDPDILAMLDP